MKKEKRKKKKKKEKKKKEKERKNAPTETGPLPQSHAQDLFVFRVRGNPSLRSSRTRGWSGGVKSHVSFREMCLPIEKLLRCPRGWTVLGQELQRQKHAICCTMTPNRTEPHIECNNQRSSIVSTTRNTNTNSSVGLQEMASARPAHNSQRQLAHFSELFPSSHEELH